MQLRMERLDDRLTPTVLVAGDTIPTQPPPSDQLCMGPQPVDPTCQPVMNPYNGVPQSPYPTTVLPIYRDVYTKPWMGC